VKPPPFGYVEPRTMAEVLDLLATHGSDARLLAGGQSLVPLMNFRLARPAVLVDLNRVAGLDTIDPHSGGALYIGSMVRQRTLERWAAQHVGWGLLARTLSLLGHTAIRTRGTIGGSLAHADPAAELPALLLCLDGEVVVRSRTRRRVIAAAEFFRGPLMTALEPDELIVEVHFPKPTGRWVIDEIARRHGDFALGGVVANAGRDGSGTVSDVRIALFGVADTPVRAREAESVLNGSPWPPSDAALTEAARLATYRLDPPGDLQATSAYRSRVARVLTRRALAAVCAQDAA
jgi:carbon-monoxide dehydrogenase medium subunit